MVLTHDCSEGAPAPIVKRLHGGERLRRGIHHAPKMPEPARSRPQLHGASAISIGGTPREGR
jgi:hypothetical protein